MGLCFVCSSLDVYAQDTGEIAYTHDKHLGKESLPVYNGVRFSDPFRSTQENFRYYKRYRPFKASVTYDGITYDSINARYDLINGNLIIYSPGALSFFQVKLASEHIDSFKLDETPFVKAKLSENHNNDPQKFYELSYNNSNSGLTLLVSRRKTPRAKRTLAGNAYYSFTTYKEYYLKKKDKYYRVNKRRDFIKLFPDHKQEIRDYYRSYRRTERENPDLFLKNLISYLDKIYS